MNLLKQLCSIHAPSGEEYHLTSFLLSYIQDNQDSWKVKPKLHSGPEFQDCIILVFGKPEVAVFSHIDSVGFSVKYNHELIRIGDPLFEDQILLYGHDSLGEIECQMKYSKSDGKYYYQFCREIDRGTSLTYHSKYFYEKENKLEAAYLDNRVGVWITLKLAETLENGIIAFTCYEEHQPGSAEMLIKYIYENYKVRQALICDMTPASHGVFTEKGVVISIRDVYIPRKKYVDKIIDIARSNNITYQLEVEDAGASDGGAIQKSPYPVDWCFIGPPQENPHSPYEIVYKFDIFAALSFYELLMRELNT